MKGNEFLKRKKLNYISLASLGINFDEITNNAESLLDELETIQSSEDVNLVRTTLQSVSPNQPLVRPTTESSALTVRYWDLAEVITFIVLLLIC